jgi:23S rRNA pseudouridine1911/1915/1917 synthase
MFTPQVMEAAGSYLVVYKPPRMHTAPLHNREESLAEWCFARFPETREPRGRKEGEGGLLHRLDFETHGLVLFARNQAALDKLMEQQEEGKICKEYGALSRKTPGSLPGFPPFGSGVPFPACIESPFRTYGPRGMAVRPAAAGSGRRGIALDRGGPYRTDIREARPVSGDNGYYLRLEISRGFRHQIRCHLAWLGFPILNDSLYGGAAGGNGVLALRARGLRFFDPATGEERNYAIAPLEARDILGSAES